MDTFKKIAMWTGIVLTGMCGVVLLGGGKVISGTLLIVTTLVMVRPATRYKPPRWVSVVLICAVFGVVTWNISTTELPNDSFHSTVACESEGVNMFERTGYKFLDQVTRILGSFLAQAAPS